MLEESVQAVRGLSKETYPMMDTKTQQRKKRSALMVEALQAQEQLKMAKQGGDPTFIAFAERSVEDIKEEMSTLDK